MIEPIIREKCVAWLYSKEHLSHPFICIAVDTLRKEGYQIAVVDAAEQIGNVPYMHIATMSFPPTNLYIGRLRIRGIGFVKLRLMLLKMLWHLLHLRPSVIIATLPDVAVVGWLASRVIRCRLVYYPFELYGEQGIPYSRLWKRLEKLIIGRFVDVLITQNAERAQFYVKRLGFRPAPLIVHNYKPYKCVLPSGRLHDRLNLPPDTRLVLYEGLLIQGRWLDKLVSAAAYLPENVKLVLLGRETVWWNRFIVPLLNAPDVSNKVLVAPWLPQSELLSYVADATVGVIIYDDLTLNNYYCEPGKLSDYVIAGVPVVVPDFPTVGSKIRRLRIGSTFKGTDASEIASAIIDVLAKPKSAWLPALKQAQRELVWETQTQRFLSAMAAAMQR